jgi:PKHD-type hydroxylase
MQIAIANILTSDELSFVQARVKAARFADGKATAGFAARLVKNNEQAAASDTSLSEVRKLVSERILANDLFRMAARPKQLTPLLISRYELGVEPQ